MADEMQVSWHHAMVAGASDGAVNRSVRDAPGPELYNEAGTARLASLEDVGTSVERVEIPAEALEANAVAMVAARIDELWVTTGLVTDDLAVGGARNLPAGRSMPVEIGSTPGGVQHTHILAIKAG